ncbi:chemotaxis protein CheD [Sulfitobacter sp. JB4-11]|uniref:chemotaxis protein CheD n=1 Tax=Sulfitobacter rhodophyticola TaxID=3238304 RepID=UPI00351552B7
MTRRAVITQGEYLVSDDPELSISTLLGSCVACCLWDPERGVGGMNHMLLTRHRSSVQDFAGVNAMELLINDLLKLGARRSHLRAKAFGGAKMVSGLSDIGAANGAFILSFLEAEAIPCMSQSLGGSAARQLKFVPTTGAVKMKMQRNTIDMDAETPPVVKPVGNGLELF